LQLARRDADGMAALEAARIGPFGSTIATLEDWWSDGAGDDPEFDEPGGTKRNALRQPASRRRSHDPCPCGSGKKFKKCCLALTFARRKRGQG